MNKSTVTTFTFNRCCINFFTDEDASFYDYTTDETIVLSGIENEWLQSAIDRYIHNLTVNDMGIEWMRELRVKLDSSIEKLESSTKD